MSAPEVVCEIVKANPEIKALLFKKYVSIKSLEEWLVGQAQVPLKIMIHHNPPEREDEIWLSRNEITPKHLNQLSKPWNHKFALAVTSKMRLFNNKKVFHIPMMDFSCTVSPENLKMIQGFLRKIKQRGVVLLSGRSYHFYGIDLLYSKNWLRFLGKCLLFTSYTDSRCIGHRLIEGYSSLRISEEERKPTLPTVVAIT